MSLSTFFGGGQGDYYQNATMQNAGLDQLNKNIKLQNDPTLNAAITGVGSGSMSLQDALKSLGGLSGQSQQAALGDLATSAVSGNQVANQQAQQMYGQAFGQNGALSQAYGQLNNLNNQGYSLQPQDYDAMGQGSNNIARQYGASGQSLANSLSMRGFGAGQSGASGAAFSGLQGSQNEALGQMQQQIANNRMQQNMQRISQTQQFIGNMQGLNQQATNSAFQNSLSGTQANNNMLSAAANNATSAFSAQSAADQASVTSKNENSSSGLIGALGTGLTTGLTGAMTGGMGSLGIGAGKALTSSIFGSGNKTPADKTE
jgi:Zn finger protein HypA/HybF involved in hydrogenase expression